MRFQRAHVDAIGYQLAPVVVTSDELEERLLPLYQALRLQRGQLAALTGIQERRWWEPDQALAPMAAAAARHALDQCGVAPEDLETVIYAGVCREYFEPATACRVAAELKVSPNAFVYDLSNACLGVVNGILDLANRVELGQIRAGVVVSAETAREIVEVTLAQMLARRDMDFFSKCLATLTGGSGAVAVVVTDGSFAQGGRHKIRGAVAKSAPEFHNLCRWGLDEAVTLHRNEALSQRMSTDSVAVMKNGVELGRRTWERFLGELEWRGPEVDRIICHQVGGPHRDTILQVLQIPAEKDFSTFEFLGNIGTVSLPVTAAIAKERELLRRGDRVGFLGIGSGLNSVMIGLDW